MVQLLLPFPGNNCRCSNLYLDSFYNTFLNIEGGFSMNQLRLLKSRVCHVRGTSFPCTMTRGKHLQSAGQESTRRQQDRPRARTVRPAPTRCGKLKLHLNNFDKLYLGMQHLLCPHPRQSRTRPPLTGQSHKLSSEAQRGRFMVY
jgi:hypothetical protein